MPHIIIEYSDNLADALKQASLTSKIRDAVVGSGLFSPEAVKGRSISYDDVYLDAGIESFIHVTIAILTGKTLEQRQALSQDVFNLVKKLVTKADKISVNIHEMEKETYCK